MHPLHGFASGLDASLLMAAGMWQEYGELQCLPQNHQDDLLVLFRLISKAQWTFYTFWALSHVFLYPDLFLNMKDNNYRLISGKLICFVFLG